jgi:tetratricopeptide (TPR) repeat protein
LVAARDQIGGRLVRRSGGYVLDVAPDLVDLHRFRRLTDRGRSTEDEPVRRAETLREAVALWRGEPLAGLRGDWAARTRESCRQQHVEAVIAWAQAEMSAGTPERVIGPVTELAAEYPLVEALVAVSMRTLHAAGYSARALELFASTRRRLADDLGADPGAHLLEAQQDILRAGVCAPGPSTSEQPDASARHPVPAQRPADPGGFTGRVAHLAGLDALLTLGGSTAVTAVLSGTAGVGKTALAVRWAHTVAARFPDGQLYANLRGFAPTGAAMAPAEAVRGFLYALGIPPERVPAGLDAQAALYRSALAGKRVLVLLDNARDAEQARPLLPGTPTALAIVTSRHQLTGLLATDGAHPLALDVLSPGEAQDLLTRRLGARVAAEPAAVRRIITARARLPLALSVAAARARQTGFPLAALAADLERAGPPLDALETGDPASQVRAVFSSSISALSPAAARLLFRLLGLHPGPDLSVAAATALSGRPGPETRQVLGELARSSLIAEHAPGRYSFHDLLRAYAVELAHLIDGERVRQDATMRLLDRYAHTAHAADRLLFPNRDPMPLPLGPPAGDIERLADYAQAMAWLDAEHQVLLAAVGHAASAGFDAYAWQLAWALDTLDLYHRAGDRVGQAFAHYNLGFLRKEQGRPEDALDHVQRAFALHRAAGHHRGQATALNAAGNCHALLGDHHRAVDACEQALVLFGEMGDRHGQATTLDSLGNAQHQLGRHDQAIVSYRRAVVLIGDLGHGRHEAEILTHLGDTQQAAGRPGEARAAWTRALGLLDELDEPDTGRLHARLGGRHATRGERDPGGVRAGLGAGGG